MDEDKVSDLPLISVIITNYNYGRYVEEAIASVLRQTYPRTRVQIIVVDDGSTDDSRERLEKYKNEVQIFYKENGGHASALNLGYQESSGEIIAFLDADDCWEEHKLETICRCYLQYAAEAVFHNLKLFGEDVDIPSLLFPDEYLSRLNRVEQGLYKLTLKNVRYSGKYLSILSGQSFRREICGKLFPMPEIFRYYTDFFLRVLGLFYCNIYYFHGSLARYRQHAASCMASYARDIRQRELGGELIEVVIRTVKDRDHDGRAKEMIGMLENAVIHASYDIERIKGNKMKAFQYLCQLKPNETLCEKWIQKMDLVMRLVLTESGYCSFKSFCRHIGLSQLRRSLR